MKPNPTTPQLGESDSRLSLQLLNPDHDRDRDHLQLAKMKSTTIVTVAKHLNNQPGETESDDPTTRRIRRSALLAAPQPRS
nr:hypothetical protein CFP56_15751 [Quercus suber]POE59546.1 hypothetical protein CFP56_15752 [Quercus suber]